MHTPHFHTYTDFATYLDTLGLFHINPSLGSVEAIIRRLRLTRPPFAVIQVVGTNGKGSTSTFLASLCTAHDLKTGLFTSPHFLSPKERILVNGTMLEESQWLGYANAVMAAGGKELTYFEILTVLALVAFQDTGVQVAVLEAGLGGTWDATSATCADMLVVTPVSLDHMAVLGNTVQEIARDKAGAVRSAVPVVSARQDKKASAIFADAARKHGATYSIAAPDLPVSITVHPRLTGAFQQANMALALHAFSTFCLHQPALPGLKTIRTTEACIVSGLEKAWIPGRMQRVASRPCLDAAPDFPHATGWPPFILDGAHNAAGLATLGLSLAKEQLSPSAIIFACLGDKEPEIMASHLRTLPPVPIFIPPVPNNARAMDPDTLASLVGLNATACTSLQEALFLASTSRAERLPEHTGDNNTAFPVLVCGSLYLLADFYALRPDCLADSLEEPNRPKGTV